MIIIIIYSTLITNVPGNNPTLEESCFKYPFLFDFFFKKKIYFVKILIK